MGSNARGNSLSAAHGLAAVAAALATDAEPEPMADQSWPHIPGYRLLRAIGAGGGGSVYEAVRDDGSLMPVAIKVMRQPFAPLRDRDRFSRVWRELDVLRELKLECVPRVLDFGVAGDRMYIVTELVDGVPLDEHCERLGLGLRERVELLVRVCDAVASLHEAAVIHRDLKPSNILVDSRGRVMIVDFGVARLARADPSVTLTLQGEVVGTTAFMAPEVAAGDAGALRSVRADVYGLGATAYVVLTGRPPMTSAAPDAEWVPSAAATQASDPARVIPGFPRALRWVLLKSCERKSERRYRDACELRDELTRWLRGSRVLANPSCASRLFAEAGRHPIAATVALCVCMALSTVAGIAAYESWYIRRPHHLEVNDNGSEVALVSRGRIRLREWTAGAPGSVILGETVVGPDENVYGAFGFSLDATGPYAGRICVFPFGRPEDLKVLDLGEQLLQSPSESRPTDRYRLRAACVADVFKNVRGQQIIALFTEQHRCQSCIVITDPVGQVHYQAWHWGQITSIRWLPTSGLLLAAGVSNEPEWDRGSNGPETRIHPPVVFAVRPDFGGHHGWLNATDALAEDQPTWYRQLAPACATSILRDARLDHPRLGLTAEACARLMCFGGPLERSSAVYWDVFASGDVRNPTPNEVYGEQPGSLDVSGLKWIHGPTTPTD